MTKKDYVKIAEGLNKAWNNAVSEFDEDTAPYPDFGVALEALCKVFKEDNPEFNEDKFLDAVKKRPE